MIPAPAAPPPARTFAAAAIRARQLPLFDHALLPRTLGALLPCGCYRRFCPFIGQLIGGAVGHGRGYSL